LRSAGKCGTGVRLTPEEGGMVCVPFVQDVREHKIFLGAFFSKVSIYVKPLRTG
jgi:hypothetical protein